MHFISFGLKAGLFISFLSLCVFVPAEGTEKQKYFDTCGNLYSKTISRALTPSIGLKLGRLKEPFKGIELIFLSFQTISN